MSSFSSLFLPYHGSGNHRFSLLDLFLVLLGAGIAYWLIPGLTDGPSL